MTWHKNYYVLAFGMYQEVCKMFYLTYVFWTIWCLPQEIIFSLRKRTSSSFSYICHHHQQRAWSMVVTRYLYIGLNNVGKRKTAGHLMPLFKSLNFLSGFFNAHLLVALWAMQKYIFLVSAFPFRNTSEMHCYVWKPTYKMAPEIPASTDLSPA